jgi:hypothetical protein
MIDLHCWPTPHGHKITMFLEEAGLPYRVVPVNIGAGEQVKRSSWHAAPGSRSDARRLSESQSLVRRDRQPPGDVRAYEVGKPFAGGQTAQS